MAVLTTVASGMPDLTVPLASTERYSPRTSAVIVRLDGLKASISQLQPGSHVPDEETLKAAQAQLEEQEKKIQELKKEMASLEKMDTWRVKWEKQFQQRQEATTALTAKEGELKGLQKKEEAFRMQDQENRDLKGQVEAMRLATEALKGNLTVAEKEKSNWESIARQRKEALLLKDQHLEQHGDKILDLEKQIRTHKEEIVQIEGEVEEFKKSETPQEKSAAKTSRIAYLILAGVAIVLAVALILYLNPGLVTAAQALVSKVWTVAPAAA